MMIKVLQKTASVMKQIAEAGAVSFTQLQESTGFHKATLANLLKTLKEIGFISRGADRRYCIGPAVVSMASSMIQRNELSLLAEKYVRLLAEQINENAVVAVLRNGRRYRVAMAHCDQAITVDSRIEQRPNPYDSATGQVLVSFADEASLAQILDVNGEPGSLWQGASTRRSLQKRIKEIRRDGMAEHVSADGQALMIAVPVRDPEGNCAAAIGISVPQYRLDDDRKKQVMDALMSARDHMQDELNWRLGGSKPAERNESR